MIERKKKFGKTEKPRALRVSEISLAIPEPYFCPLGGMQMMMRLRCTAASAALLLLFALFAIAAQVRLSL